ncbi:MAG: 4-hydroxy-tetrahydrodipicolinate reductase [Ruminococcaceae bacterium]|nr:4-hydroxy-tetrahydrodipicolinate reductase [Oscillospiraceae bacterium]
MIDILLCGCRGVMGKMIAEIAATERFSSQLRISAGVDIKEGEGEPFPVYRSIENVTSPVDAVIDFSHPSLLSDVLAYACKYSVPVVLATTGYSAEQKNEITAAAEKIPVFFSPNMSIGVTLVSELIKKAAATLGMDYDVEIVEKHHNRKLDAPSGTALMLADSVVEADDRQFNYVYDRHSERRARQKNEIGIHSVRGGTIVGEHDVIFAGEDEVITISHSAGSRKIFAFGALRAALFISDKPSGLYKMSDTID